MKTGPAVSIMLVGVLTMGVTVTMTAPASADTGAAVYCGHDRSVDGRYAVEFRSDWTLPNGKHMHLYDKKYRTFGRWVTYTWATRAC